MAVNELELTYTPSQLEIFFSDSQAKYTIVTKGRRFGATQGAEKAFIEYALDGITPLLWVDTINGNIDRYFERYFLPDLKKIKDVISWEWNTQKRFLKIQDSIIDFRSADNPESIEGFGYKKIFLNEAGIILKDDYLYSNAILPMLLDFPDSQLIAAGVPKGKHKKDGEEHKFYQLYKNAKANKKGYRLLEYTSYDNPLISKDEIDALQLELSQMEAEQEIYGKFVDFAGNNPFAHQYKETKHESPSAIFRPDKQLIISIDFNLNPFAVTFWHYWRDNTGEHIHCFDELEISNGSIPAMIDAIKLRYPHHLHSARLTGDSMGKNRSIEQRDNSSLYDNLLRGLGMTQYQLQCKHNPTHENSREQVNNVLFKFNDFKINPINCPNLCRDMKNVQCDAFGQILKKDRKDVNQRADYLDTCRSVVHNILADFK